MWSTVPRSSRSPRNSAMNSLLHSSSASLVCLHSLRISDKTRKASEDDPPVDSFTSPSFPFPFPSNSTPVLLFFDGPASAPSLLAPLLEQVRLAFEHA